MPTAAVKIAPIVGPLCSETSSVASLSKRAIGIIPMAIGIIPIALLLSDATEEVSEHSGPTIGAIFTAAVGIFIVNFVKIDAKSNWLEGVLL